jgi:hypothetical protein
VAQITRATRRYGFDAEAPPPAPAPSPATAPASEEGEERHVAFGTDDRGWWARLRLPVDEGAAVEAALLAARQRLHRADPDARPSWADAVVALVSAGDRPPRAHAVVHLEARTGGPGWVAGLGGAPAPLPDALRRTLTCDADAELVRLVDGRPVDAGRRQRVVPERLRRLVVHRDGGTCRVPGCDRRLWLHVHHVVHWEDGGPTDLANLCLLCPAHHRRHHRGLLGIVAAGPEGAAGELAFTDERGHRLDPSGRARPPGPGDAPAVGPYAHPAGEPLRSRWVHFQRGVDPHPDAA